MTSKEVKNLPSQRTRNLSDRRGGAIVPDTPMSISNDGPKCMLSTSMHGDNVIADQDGATSSAPVKIRKERVLRSPSASSMEMDETEREELSDSSVVRPDGSHASRDDSLAKRKRGRPQTHGDYVGLAEQRKKLKSARVLLDKLENQKDLTYRVASADSDTDPAPGGRRTIVKEITIADLALKSPEEIRQYSTQAAERIMELAAKSSNLKGGYVRDLKKQARLQEAAAIELSRRVAMGESERIRMLEDEMARLSAILESKNAEIQRLNKRVEEIGRKRANLPDLPAGSGRKKRNSPKRRDPETTASSGEETDLPNMRKVKTMILREFASLRQELLGPLTPLERNKTLAQVVAGHPGTARTASEKKKKKNEKTPMQERLERARMPPPPPPAKEPRWEMVTSRRSKKAGKEAGEPPKRPSGNQPGKKTGKQGKSGPNADKGKRVETKPKLGKPPKLAAVTVTIPEGRELTMAEVLAEARANIDLAEMEIPHLVPKVALTGAMILGVPGPESNARADRLAGKMKDIFEERGVVITRPQKRAELRIRELEDSITSEEVLKVVAEKGRCHRTEVKVGEIRRSRSGLGSVWVQCPLVAARLLADEGKIKIGWVVARIEILKARPLICFRCLEKGHVRQQCPSEIDRSADCYNCGEKGHKAAECRKAPKCAICTARGLPAKHKLGGASCGAPVVLKKNKRDGTKRTPEVQVEGTAGTSEETHATGAESGLEEAMAIG